MPGIIGWDAIFIGLCLEGFFYGLYSGIFVLYIQYQVSEKGSYKTNNIHFYALCALYVLSSVTIVMDTMGPFFAVFGTSALLHLRFVQEALSGCCSFVSQSILIYRCWIVWGHNIFVVIIPSILAFTFLAIYLAVDGSLYIFQGELVIPNWGNRLSLASLALSPSLTVNALVTGLIVFRIFRVYREVEDSQALSVTGRSKLRTIMFVLIESGMTLFAAQVVQVVTSTLQTQFAREAFYITVGIPRMLYGITPTIILVRVAMGLSFHDEESMIEIAGSLHFVPSNPGPVLEWENQNKY